MRYTLAACVLLALVLALFIVITVADSTSGRAAVVDRLGDDYAVLLIETAGETTDQRVVDPNAIPEAGRHEGAVLHVDDGGYRYDRVTTTYRSRVLSKRVTALAQRMP